MPQHSEYIELPYSAEQIYWLVLNIESYPEFLPWCTAARILERQPTSLKAELLITFKAFREKYTSQVTFEPPHSPALKAGTIDVHMVEGPFAYLENKWRFEPLASGGTRVSFHINFAFRSKIFDTLIGIVFEKAVHKMVEAFTKRAVTLYGTPS